MGDFAEKLSLKDRERSGQVEKFAVEELHRIEIQHRKETHCHQIERWIETKETVYGLQKYPKQQEINLYAILAQRLAIQIYRARGKWGLGLYLSNDTVYCLRKNHVQNCMLKKKKKGKEKKELTVSENMRRASVKHVFSRTFNAAYVWREIRIIDEQRRPPSITGIVWLLLIRVRFRVLESRMSGELLHAYFGEERSKRDDISHPSVIREIIVTRDRRDKLSFPIPVADGLLRFPC